MIGFTSPTEGVGKILNWDKFVSIWAHISDLITIPSYISISNFGNTVNCEVVHHVR